MRSHGFKGGGEGGLEDSELNGVSSLLKMKGRVGESNVNGKEKDSSEAVGLELMVISFM